MIWSKIVYQKVNDSILTFAVEVMITKLSCKQEARRKSLGIKKIHDSLGDVQMSCYHLMY